MSDYLPVTDASSSAPSPARGLRQAVAVRRAELELFQHSLRSGVRTAKELIDSQAVGVCAEAALDEELDLLNYGRNRAAADPLAMHFALRKVEKLARINERRLQQRFG